MSPETARAQLHAAGAAAGPPPLDLGATVLATRRHRRRRTGVVAGAALAVLLVAAGVPAVLGGPPSPAAVAAAGGPVQSLPTRGSLAGDAVLVAGLQQLPWVSSTDGAGAAYRAFDAGNPVAGSPYDVATDLAAAVPADQRDVVWVDDVPGGRWALLAIPIDGGYAAAWFVGPAGAGADRMTMSGPVQLVAEDEPMAHVDLANPDRALVVVAAPGAVVSLVDAVTVQADGSTTQKFQQVDAPDGVSVTTLTTPVRYGVPVTVRVASASREWQARPTAAGQTSGVPWGSAFGWPAGDPETPSIQLTRGTSGLSVGRVLSDTMLASVLGPTGLTLQDIDPSGPQISEIFSGTRDGALPDPFTGDPADVEAGQAPVVEPSIAVWDVRLPSGAQAVLAGWAVVEDPEAGQVPAAEQTLLTLRGPDFDPASDLVATRMDLPAADGRPAETVVVVAGDPAGATARLLDGTGAEVARVPLREGTGVAPDPTGSVDRVEVLDGDGDVLQADGLSSGIAPLFPAMDDPSFLASPIAPATPTPTTEAPVPPTDPVGTPPAGEYGQRMADCLRPLGFLVTVIGQGEGFSVDGADGAELSVGEAVEQCQSETGYA